MNPNFTAIDWHLVHLSYDCDMGLQCVFSPSGAVSGTTTRSFFSGELMRKQGSKKCCTDFQLWRFTHTPTGKLHIYLADLHSKHGKSNAPDLKKKKH